MRYLPHTQKEIEAMLKVVGVDDLDGLFCTVPENCRRAEDPKLPDPLTEWELNELLDSLSSTMGAAQVCKVFLGSGSYEHYIPHAVTYLLSRSEFVTCYTPYQPEMSQGTLQGIYEYQTLACRLLGMEVANASLYDGASALAEALLMAIRVTKQNKVALSRLIHPHHRRVVQTYFEPTEFELVELPYLQNGRTDLSTLKDMDDLAAVAIQSPNFFGCIEDLGVMAKEVHRRGGLFITSFTEPLAYGLLKNPGDLGADLACGEGQSLGIPQAFGGPGLGMFATKMKYVRNMPGRLVGQALDMNGKRGFVLTLATREQHIRRQKATSNICTNNSLCALAAAMYMASLGGSGLRELARLNHDKAEYLKKELEKTGARIPFNCPSFNEFVVEFPVDFETTYERLLHKNIVPGFPLSPHYPELSNCYLFCVTETKTRDDMDILVKEIQS